MLPGATQVMAAHKHRDTQFSSDFTMLHTVGKPKQDIAFKRRKVSQDLRDQNSGFDGFVAVRYELFGKFRAIRYLCFLRCRYAPKSGPPRNVEKRLCRVAHKVDNVLLRRSFSNSLRSAQDQVNVRVWIRNSRRDCLAQTRLNMSREGPSLAVNQIVEGQATLQGVLIDKRAPFVRGLT